LSSLILLALLLTGVSLLTSLGIGTLSLVSRLSRCSSLLSRLLGSLGTLLALLLVSVSLLLGMRIGSSRTLLLASGLS